MKTKIITLVLITAALASCQKKKPRDPNRPNVYMRADESAGYDRQNDNFWLWYYAFRPYGYYGSNGMYNRAGYYSSGINQSSNIGSSSFKGSVVRGGFGSGYSVSS